MAMRYLLSPVSVSVTLRMVSTRGATRCYSNSKGEASYDDRRNADNLKIQRIERQNSDKRKKENAARDQEKLMKKEEAEKEEKLKKEEAKKEEKLKKEEAEKKEKLKKEEAEKEKEDADTDINVWTVRIILSRMLKKEDSQEI